MALNRSSPGGPEAAEEVKELGNMAYELQEFEEALECYLEAARLDPANAVCVHPNNQPQNMCRLTDRCGGSCQSECFYGLWCGFQFFWVALFVFCSRDTCSLSLRIFLMTRHHTTTTMNTKRKCDCARGQLVCSFLNCWDFFVEQIFRIAEPARQCLGCIQSHVRDSHPRLIAFLTPRSSPDHSFLHPLHT